MQIMKFFFSFTLLDLITRNESMQNVVRAVTLNVKALSLTALLGALFIYYFAIWGTLFLKTDFTSPAGVALCNNIWDCWQAMFEYALLTGGSTNNGQLGPPNIHEPTYYTRFVFDVIYFIIIILIFLNVFFGIIIDTFGELRGACSEKEEDMKNVCFICSIDRTTFERNGTGFEIHTSVEHNLWHYLYYMVFIKTKDVSEFTGIEQYVYNMIQDKDIAWFPMSKSMSLDTTSAADSDDDVSSQTKAINKKLDDLFNVAKDIIKRQQQSQDTANRGETLGRKLSTIPQEDL